MTKHIVVILVSETDCIFKTFPTNGAMTKKHPSLSVEGRMPTPADTAQRVQNKRVITHSVTSVKLRSHGIFTNIKPKSHSNENIKITISKRKRNT